MSDVVFEIKANKGAAVRGAEVLVAYPDGRYLTGQTTPTVSVGWTYTAPIRK